MLAGVGISAAAVTVDQASAQINNPGGATGLVVVLNMTNAGTGSVTLTINGVSPSGVVYPLLVGAAVTSNGVTVYRVGRGLTAAANATAVDVVPGGITLNVHANNANPTSYVVDYLLV